MRKYFPFPRLLIVLTGMQAPRNFTFSSGGVGKKVLRDNAVKLYNLNAK